MGWSFHGRKRDVDAEKHLKRLHKTTPLIESPLQGADHESLVFSQRHEANTAELFFDLFFVANLATFTTYHSITDHTYLVAYIGFFGILWSSWFQVTLHDVRFARDSLYERVCKTIQMIVFVGLALVGSSFNPGARTGSNKNFRILCYTLVISRSLLAIQYLVVLVYTFMARYSKLYLPIGLMAGIYIVAAAAFGAMTPAFKEKEEAHGTVYVVWYVVMVLEAVGAIVISSCWRMMSFKKTHLMERMSLLTLIVIGEGAIGVTKTVSRIMGKSGLDVEGCFLIMCIIVILVFIWALYFDNFPHGHYGTIRQQIWSLLHFPFQLAIVGVVEGSQQIALARYVNKNYDKILNDLINACFTKRLDGQKLQDDLIKMVEYWGFDKKLETYNIEYALLDTTYKIGNTTGYCSAENAPNAYQFDNWPAELAEYLTDMLDGVYVGLGIKLPTDKLEKMNAIDVAIKSWRLVYLYYWSSFCLLIVCAIFFLFLIRRHRADLFDFVSVIIRFVALAIGALLMALMANTNALYSFLSGPAILPVTVTLFFLILFFDKISALFCNWRLKKSGQEYALEHDDDHHHHEHHDSSHEQLPSHARTTAHQHHDSLTSDYRKSTAWSMYSDSQPLTSPDNSEYHGGAHQQQYAMTPLMSPPMVSPTPAPAHTVAHGGYMPVSTSQNYGA